MHPYYQQQQSFGAGGGPGQHQAQQAYYQQQQSYGKGQAASGAGFPAQKLSGQAGGFGINNI